MALIYALDWGEKRWGLASCQLEFGICLPQKNLVGKNKLEEFLEILHEENCTWVLIGYPLNMDGTRSKNCGKIDKLKSMLELKGFKVDLCDERMSSELAEENLLEQGIRGKKKKKNLDSHAAMFILQEFLRGIT